MKNSPMGSLSKDLLASARHDRPSEAQRSRIWEQVAIVPHLSLVAPIASEMARSTSIAPAKLLAGGLSASKLLVAGAIAGSALTIGLGMLLTHAPSPKRGVGAVVDSRTVARPVIAADGVGREAPRTQTTELDDLEVTPAAALPRGQHDNGGSRGEPRGRKPQPIAAAAADVSQDVLMHDAALVSQARTAIVQGRAAAALDVLDLAAREGSHTLEPEELSLRVRALRLLGRESEALVVEERLRSRYPASFLSR